MVHVAIYTSPDAQAYMPGGYALGTNFRELRYGEVRILGLLIEVRIKIVLGSSAKPRPDGLLHPCFICVRGHN